MRKCKNPNCNTAAKLGYEYCKPQCAPFGMLGHRKPPQEKATTICKAKMEYEKRRLSRRIGAFGIRRQPPVRIDIKE